eukprot:m.34449 g.34449  ORF g.34449 m.34449 type:complete len:159 (+) comp9767_c0_seq3:367-843(+)
MTDYVHGVNQKQEMDGLLGRPGQLWVCAVDAIYKGVLGKLRPRDEVSNTSPDDIFLILRRGGQELYGEYSLLMSSVDNLATIAAEILSSATSFTQFAASTLTGSHSMWRALEVTVLILTLCPSDTSVMILPSIVTSVAISKGSAEGVTSLTPIASAVG